jgi:hypothetical protein
MRIHTIPEGGVQNPTVTSREGMWTTTTAALGHPALMVITIGVTMIGREDTIVAITNDRVAHLLNDLVTLLLFLRVIVAMSIPSTNPTALVVLPLCNRTRQLCPRIDRNDSKNCWRKRKLKQR